MIQPPEYTDGVLKLYKIKNDDSKDYPEEILSDMDTSLWYREISVFDRTKYEFDQGGKEVTMKVRIPRYKKVDSNCVCVIEGIQHLVYNAAHIIDKNGFQETELTLVRPEKELRINGQKRVKRTAS